MEQWKLIEKNGIHYNVSNMGNVQIINFDKKESITTHTKVKDFAQWGGHKHDRYLALNSIYIHRLVAEAWIGPIPEGWQVNHLDGNKWNNKATNLQITTPSENIRHAFENGLNTVEQKKVVFYVIDTDEKQVVAEFYSEESMACFLFSIGAEMNGTVKEDLLKHFPKSKYQVVRAA